MNIKTAEEFAQTLRNYAKENQLTQAEVARKLGLPRQTVGHWFTQGIKPEKNRNAVIDQFPDVFSEEYRPKKEVQTKNSLPPNPAMDLQRFTVIIKSELGRQGVVALTDILQWFVNDSAENRNYFRSKLGKVWDDFLNLTRAMTGEHALEIAIKEGRINRNGNND